MSEDGYLNDLMGNGNAYSRSARAAFGSFGEPHVARTPGVFDATERYVPDPEWSQFDIDRAIIATTKGDFRPVRLGPATGAALQRHRRPSADPPEATLY